MLRRFFVVFLLWSSIVNTATAQTFTNSYGVTLSFLSGRETPGGPYKNILTQECGTYFPRLNLSENDNSSFSIGIPLSAGIGSVSNGGGVAYSIDAPLVGDYNFGCNSTPDNEAGVGGYIGAGFGYTYTNFASYFGSGNVSTYGPMLHTGIRFIISQKFSQALVLGVYYKLGIESEKYKTFGINILGEF
ncbi:MAG: hypothetical protein Q8891_09155 [Bacteroidota bacterium]|nr:hypothetical protein [Bacteroidota bacterium]